jgi:hypothetical protein
MFGFDTHSLLGSRLSACFSSTPRAQQNKLECLSSHVFHLSLKFSIVAMSLPQE